MKWKWNLSNIKQDKNIKVFSCFSCGGGSSMGYKKAGFSVIGNVEIDPKINKMYVSNNHPKYNYCMDLRDFNNLEELPEELYELDILDGSPPCSTFSMAGKREAGWGVEKAFREGQKKQRLDDLFFVFLDTVEKLKPKVVIAENVKGLLQGNARWYVKEIYDRFRELGYQCQIFLLNSANMDVPQARERVFFIANCKGFKKLDLSFDSEPILFKEVRASNGEEVKSVFLRECLKKMESSDRDVSYITQRVNGKKKRFSDKIAQDHYVCGTITSAGLFIRGCDKKMFTQEDFRNVQTFPQDYDFCGIDAQYVCGMSVPPNMMANIAKEIYGQWFANE